MQMYETEFCVESVCVRLIDEWWDLGLSLCIGMCESECGRMHVSVCVCQV